MYTLDDTKVPRVSYQSSILCRLSIRSAFFRFLMSAERSGNPLGAGCWLQFLVEDSARYRPSFLPRSPHLHNSSSLPMRFRLSSPAKGSFIVSEGKDISRQRLADFLAARLRARGLCQPESQRTRADSSAVISARPEEDRTPSADS
jgi:hypothetical protein